jgi:hypothetical protein
MPSILSLFFFFWFFSFSHSESPKGKLATLSTDSPCFECHIRYSNVKEVHQVIVSKFEKTLRVTRFIDQDGTTMLSVILHTAGSDEATTEKNIQAWEKLRSTYGEIFTPDLSLV